MNKIRCVLKKNKLIQFTPTEDLRKEFEGKFWFEIRKWIWPLIILILIIADILTLTLFV